MDCQLSRRRLNNNIRRSEAKVAVGLASSLWRKLSLESDLEWLVTWAIKKANVQDSMWCGGTKILDLKRLPKNQFDISAIAYVGSESDSSNRLTEAQLKGVITLNGHSNKLKGYHLIVTDNGTKYELQK